MSKPCFKAGTAKALLAMGLINAPGVLEFIFDFARKENAPGGTCSRCGGQGICGGSWGHHDGGRCYKCGGSGFIPYSLSKARMTKLVKSWNKKQSEVAQ